MAWAKQIDNYGDTNWYLVDRKPYRCPSCNSRKIGKAILGYPTEEDFYDESIITTRRKFMSKQNFKLIRTEK